ncbi:MAG: DUF433 domain-containing protein [Labilithrix sp.]|nr:DUF433 domain-containing protein [Labilithrix sp.]
MAAAPSLSALEVAALVDLDEGKIRKDVEHGIVDRPRFSIGDLVYFRLLALLGLQVSVADRRRIHSLVEGAMKRKPLPETIALSTVTEVRVADVAEEMTKKLDRFSAWKYQLVEDPKILGGEPVFPRSRTSVRHVGGLLLRGVPEDELREDYPHLKSEDFELAKLYAKAYPRMGRPREAAPR